MLEWIRVSRPLFITLWKHIVFPLRNGSLKATVNIERSQVRKISLLKLKKARMWFAISTEILPSGTFCINRSLLFGHCLLKRYFYRQNWSDVYLVYLSLIFCFSFVLFFFKMQNSGQTLECYGKEASGDKVHQTKCREGPLPNRKA